MDRKPCGPASQRHQISGPASGVAAQDRDAGVGEVARPRGRSPRCRARAAEQAGEGGARPPSAGSRATSRSAPTTELPQSRRPGHGRVLGAVEDQAPPLVAVSLARRAHRSTSSMRRGGVEARGQPDPHRGRQVGPSDGGLDRRDRDELGDEAVVVGGQLAVHAVREGVGQEVAGQPGRGVVAPRVGLGVPGEGAGRDQPSGFLGDRVVVGRGAMAAEGGEVLLVPPDLVQRLVVVLEQVTDLGQPSSSRRTHAQEISRMPSSMPLVQWTPERNGLAAHQERRWRRRARRRRSSSVSQYAAASTVRWWCRDSSQTCLTLPVTDSSRWSMRNA